MNRENAEEKSTEKIGSSTATVKDRFVKYNPRKRDSSLLCTEKRENELRHRLWIGKKIKHQAVQSKKQAQDAY